METFSWVGVALLAVMVTVWLVFVAIDMFRSEMGRGVLYMLGIGAIVMWGFLGGIWLLVEHLP